MPTLISKAYTALSTYIRKASRGTLSSYVLNAPHQYGQPLPEVAAGDALGLVTPEWMREIATKVATVAASVNTILDFSGNVPLVVRNVQKSKKVPDVQMRHVMSFLTKPNPHDTGLQFFKMLRRDLVTMGYAAIELERDRTGRIANMWVLDAAKLRKDYDEHGTLLGYNMVDARGVPISTGGGPYTWRSEDVIYFRLAF